MTKGRGLRRAKRHLWSEHQNSVIRLRRFNSSSSASVPRYVTIDEPTARDANISQTAGDGFSAGNDREIIGTVQSDGEGMRETELDNEGANEVGVIENELECNTISNSEE